MKSLKQHVTEALALGDGRIERLLTDKEVQSKYPNEAELIMPLLKEIKKPRENYEKVVTEINSLIEKRDANKGAEWDKYQHQIAKLASERDNAEKQFRDVLKKAEKVLKTKKTAEYFFIVEKK